MTIALYSVNTIEKNTYSGNPGPILSCHPPNLTPAKSYMSFEVCSRPITKYADILTNTYDRYDGWVPEIFPIYLSFLDDMHTPTVYVQV
jgi:hypothetical protein